MIISEAIRYAFVGGIGFLADAGLFSVMTILADWDNGSARLLSFSGACSLTWLLNRSFTFCSALSDRKGREYVLYITTQILGAGINMSVFFGLIHISREMASLPIIPLALGALVSAVFTFLASKYIIWQTDDQSHRILRQR